jgi:hypothetical protein
MDPLTRLLFFLSRLVRRPPSRGQALAMLVALALALGLVGIEHYWGWPDWLRTERVPMRRFAL